MSNNAGNGIEEGLGRRVHRSDESGRAALTCKPTFTDQEVDAYIDQMATTRDSSGYFPMIKVPGKFHAFALALGYAVIKRQMATVSTELTPDEWVRRQGCVSRCRLLGKPDPPPPYLNWTPGWYYESWCDTMMIPSPDLRNVSLALADTSGGVIHRTQPIPPCISYGNVDGMRSHSTYREKPAPRKRRWYEWVFWGVDFDIAR